MRPIDRTNYEAWLLDRLEGRLSQEEARALDAFLDLNPDLRPEGGDLPVIPSAIIPFDEKQDLKRALPPTGMPNMQTIEDHLVARLEGGLSQAQEAALDELLKKDGTAARAWSLMQRARISAGPVAFPDQEKLALKRALPPAGMPVLERLDDFLVARMEGELTPGQDAALDDLLSKDDAAARSWALMRHTRVLPAEVEFPDKDRLKKRGTKVIALWQRYAVAASIALLLGLAWWALTERGDAGPQVTEKENTVVPDTKGSPPVPPSEEQKPGPMAKVEGKITEPAPRSEDQEATEESTPRPSNSAREPAPERIDPLLAQRPREEPTPMGRSIPDVPVTDDPPVEFAEDAAVSPAKSTMTLGELLATTVRAEVLDQPDAPAHALDGDDAAALVDKSLGAVSGDRAGLTYQRSEQRRRFRLRLGDNLAFAASTSR